MRINLKTVSFTKISGLIWIHTHSEDTDQPDNILTDFFVQKCNHQLSEAGIVATLAITTSDPYILEWDRSLEVVDKTITLTFNTEKDELMALFHFGE